MNKLDLDIEKYSVDELREIFDVPSDSDIIMLTDHFNQLKITINNDSALEFNQKDRMVQFLENVTQKLITSLDIYKSKFYDKKNQLVNESSISHPLIEDPNVIGGKNAKIYGGKNVSGQEYPPGYINPINMKTIKRTVNIDSRFREEYYATKSSNFHLNLPDSFKKIVSMELDSFELPLSIYSINASNSCFTIEKEGDPSETVDISYGNYNTPYNSKIFQEPAGDIIQVINTNSIFSSSDLSYNIDGPSGKSVITNELNDKYII